MEFCVVLPICKQEFRFNPTWHERDRKWQSFLQTGSDGWLPQLTDYTSYSLPFLTVSQPLMTSSSNKLYIIFTSFPDRLTPTDDFHNWQAIHHLTSSSLPQFLTDSQTHIQLRQCQPSSALSGAFDRMLTEGPHVDINWQDSSPFAEPSIRDSVFKWVFTSHSAQWSYTYCVKAAQPVL